MAISILYNFSLVKAPLKTNDHPLIGAFQKLPHVMDLAILLLHSSDNFATLLSNPIPAAPAFIAIAVKAI